MLAGPPPPQPGHPLTLLSPHPDAGHTTPAACAAPGAGTVLQLSAGQVLGDGGPFSAAGGARSYGMWGVQIRECPRPPHCKVASCGEQGPGGGGYVSFRFFVFVFVFLTCRSAARLGAASGTERRWLCFPHAPRHCGLAASPAAAAPHPTPGPGLRPERLAPPCCAS